MPLLTALGPDGISSYVAKLPLVRECRATSFPLDRVECVGGGRLGG